MSPVTANPDLLEFSLCKELGLSPNNFRSQEVTFPPFKEILRWIFFGKPLKVILRKGLSAKKVDKFMTILNEFRIQEQQEADRIESEARLRSGQI